MSFVINTCSECNETLEDEFETCLDCGKQNICSYCIRTLSQDGNSYRGCIKCSDEETKREEERKFLKRKTTVNSIRLSCAYRGVIEDDSMILLNEVLEDYLKNGTLYINKEIFIVDNDKVHVYQTDNGNALVTKDKSIKDKSIKDKSIKDKSIKDKSIKDKSIKDKSIKYKMVLNLYNYNCLRSDTFTIAETFEQTTF